MSLDDKDFVIKEDNYDTGQSQDELIVGPLSSSPLVQQQEPNMTKRFLQAALMSVKAEILLHSFRQAIYWQSLLEISITVVQMLLHFINGIVMAQVWLHILHLVRPIFGYRLLYYLPQSHKLLDELPDSLVEITNSTSNNFMQELTKSKRPFALYFFITACCTLLDSIGMIIDLFKIGGNENWSVIYSVTTWIFLCFDFYFLLVLPSLQYMLPGDPVTNFWNIGKGYATEIKTFFEAAYNQYLRRAENQPQAQPN